MKCPMCFHDLPDVPLVAVCTGSCDEARQPWADEVRGYEVKSRTIFETRDQPPAWTCPQCKVPTRQEACKDCAYPIPGEMRNWETGNPIPGRFLTMAGARASGKSLMIATMMQQFKMLCEQHYQVPLKPLGTTEERFNTYYLNPLYVSRQVMRATFDLSVEQGNPTREPLVWAFRDSSVPPGQQQERILAIRDVAGEDLENLQQRNPRSFSFFGRANAVVAMVDPLKVQEVRGYLEGLITVPRRESLGGDDVRVLQNVMELVRSSTSGQTALGLAVSKFDVLQELRWVETKTWQEIMGRVGSPIFRDPSLSSPKYDRGDGDLLHHEVLGILQELGASSTLGLVANSGLRYRMFATSALGANPTDQENLHPVGIAPFRVLDPLKWVLDGATMPSDGR